MDLIAPPPRVVIGPVTSAYLWENDGRSSHDVREAILDRELAKHTGKRFRVEITAKATEILEGEQ